MSEAEHRTDVAVIGAGPAGLFTVFQCGMLDMRCHVVDVLDVAGGQLSALYPEKPIFDIPGHPEVMAGDLVDRLLEQAAPFEPTYHLGQRVESLEPADGGRWRLTTSAGTTIDAGAVVLAAGVGAFGPNRPPIEGIEAYEGRSLFYLVKRREDFRGRRVVIAGGGDSAVDWALSLADVAEKVWVVHRRAKFRAAPESVRKLHRLDEEGKVELVVPYQPAGLEGEDGQIRAVVLKDLDGTPRRIEADTMLAFYGLAMNLGPITEWGLEFEGTHVRVDPATCETSRPGVYAVGDIATYPGKLKLILCGFSEVAMAAHAMYGRIHPGEALHFEYSTTRGVPEAR